jgi:hypothetical protein
MIGLIVVLWACLSYCYPSKRYVTVFLLLFLATAGFQLPPIELMTMPQLRLTKSYDWIFVFLSFALLVHPSVFFNRQKWAAFRYVNILFLFLLLLLFYSVLVQQVQLPVAIRVFRNYTFIILVYLFCELDEKDIKKIFRLVACFTALASVIYCLQLVAGRSLLNNLLDDYSNLDLQINNGLVRYYNIPILGTPVFFLLLADKSVVGRKFSWMLLLPVSCAILLSQHRNLLLAIIACCLIYYIIRNNMGILKVSLVLLVSAGVLLGINSITGNRFGEGASDLTSLFKNGITENDVRMADVNLLSTDEFRFYHFYERISYVLETPARSIFGIGLISEDSRAAKDLHFNIGLPNDSRDVTQIDTGDIVWSLLVMHLGLLGTLLFILMYTDLLRRMWRTRNDPKMMAAFLFILTLLFTSFYGMGIVIPPVTCLTMLFAAYLYRCEQRAPVTGGHFLKKSSKYQTATNATH